MENISSNNFYSQERSLVSLKVVFFESNVICRKRNNFVRVIVRFNTSSKSLLKEFESFISDCPEFSFVRVSGCSLHLELQSGYFDAFGILAMYLDLFNLFRLNY